MTLTFFLRRHRISPARYEYYYITAESFDLELTDNIIAPSLPGNDASIVTGPGSSNFQITLGRLKVMIRLSGYILPVVGTEYPTLTDPAVHVVTVKESAPSEAEIEGTKNSKTVSGTVNGVKNRTRLIDFVADQASGKYDEFVLGSGAWGADANGSSPADSTIAGQETRIWEGLVRTCRTREVAGEPDQFMFALDFEVGDN